MSNTAAGVEFLEGKHVCTGCAIDDGGFCRACMCKPCRETKRCDGKMATAEAFLP